MEYLVTGATGFVGGAVARQLAAAGHKVRALVRDPDKAKALRALGATLCRGDVTERSSLAPAMEGVDGVFHIAGWYKVGERDTSAAYPVNVEGTRNVLDAMKAAGVAKGVYTSTLAVKGDTRGRVVDESYRMQGPFLSVYDRTKWVAHYEVAEPMMHEGLPLVIVMPGVVYGPGDTSQVRTTFVEFLQGKLRGVPKGFAVCWAHIEDTARGHVLAMEKGRPGESYIIAGEPRPLTQVMAFAEKVTGVSAPRLHPSPAFMRFLSAASRLVGNRARGEAFRVYGGTTYLGSSEKAIRELGFRPRPLEEGLRETLEHEMRLLGMEPRARPT